MQVYVLGCNLLMQNERSDIVDGRSYIDSKSFSSVVGFPSITLLRIVTAEDLHEIYQESLIT